MPGLRYKILCMPDMSEKKSPPRKEKPQYIKTPQSDGKGMKRKLMVPEATPEDDDKRITPKRKRALLMPDSSPEAGSVPPVPRTPGSISRITVPLSERQQMALIMRMSDGTSQGESSPKPSSPTTPVSSSKRTTGDKKVNKRNDRGETALHTAAKRGDVKQTKRLIKAGANVNIKDYAGWTPLHEACNQGMLLVAKQLLKAGADVNVQGFDDDTPLHDASVNGHPKLVELLLKNGANPLQTNNKGKSALDVAASPDIEQVLRKEIISSSSDSSSIDDARSPTSPESTSSNKDEDSRPEDVQDVETHSDMGGVSSSSGSRRMLIPKSPEKTGSPRLCLKFQPTKPQYKGPPRHQSYSLTVVTNDQNTNSSPPGSPVSSIDSDLYDPELDHTLPPKETVMDETAAATSWLKMAENTGKGDTSEADNRYQLKTQETQAFSPHSHTFEDISDGDEDDERIQNTVGKNNQVENSQHIPQDTGDPGNSRLSSDLTSQNVQSSSSTGGGANSLFSSSSPSSSVSSSTERTPSHAYHNSQRRASMGSSSLIEVGVIHKPFTRWELHSSPKRDDSDVSVSQSNKFKVFDVSENSPLTHEKDNVSPKVEKECIPGSPRPRSDSKDSRPSSPRTRSEHDVRPLSPKPRQDRPNSPKTRSDSRESRPVSPKLRSDRDSRDGRPASPKTRSELRDSRESRPSSPKTRSELRDSKDGRPNSPRPRSEKGSRSSSPKVPPLKIIIPQKTAPSSSMDEKCLKLLLTKPALPYVLNPTQEKEAEAVLTEMCQQSHNTSRSSSPASSRPSSRASAAPSEEGKREKLFREAASSKPQIDDPAKENSRDGKELREIKTEAKEEGQDEKEDLKEEKEERRVTRTLRSHTAMLQQQQQQQQQQKQDKTDKVDKQEKNGAPEPVPTNNSQNDNGSSNRSHKAEDMDYMNIHPRKRKLRPKPESQALGDNQQPTAVPAPLPPPATSYEKPPNPFELYLNIRKQIANRQQSLSTVHPKAPSGFKDYLMVNCTYVLQGNATSTLSVPVLSPPNSVEGPMRELFQEQEKARYNLRLQHLIEREKLMLSIEQEILREHGRAARALANQSLPLSVCTILKDEEIYNMQELEQAAEAEDKNVRSRYNGRQFISWLQDVGDKYEKIKEYLLNRHHHEADSLFAVQKMDWEWKLKSCGLCDYNTTPVIDDLHVPMVQVNDEFELLPT